MCNRTPVPEPSPDPVTSDPSCQVILMPPWPAMKPESTMGDGKYANIKQLKPMYYRAFFPIHKMWNIVSDPKRNQTETFEGNTRDIPEL